ncbi:hypothetical protein V6N11_072208 [Hibiscus sabdariffa]|uniref:Uncharacterized protein n=1 Tax=Hibiscus sabdariffa TaxID=183260 RepID=A0ABR2U2S2_9ROSI
MNKKKMKWAYLVQSPISNALQLTRVVKMLKDKSKLQIILLLLHIDIRARFNYTTTWECIWSMTDKAYGYRNMIFSRIDIMTVTYPEPCDVNSVIYAMFLWSKVLPIYAANIWKAIMPDFTHELVNFEQAFKKEIVADNEAILEKLLGAKESCNSLHDTGQQGSKLTIVNKIHRKDTPQPTLNDARADGASSESQEDLQGHDGEMSAAVQQEPDVNINQPQVDHSLGHARQDTGVSFAGDELESCQIESDNPITDEGFYEIIPEEETNQESTDADQITEMVLSSEQATNQSNNMSSNSAFNPDMSEDVTLSSQQDDVVVTQSSVFNSLNVTKRWSYKFRRGVCIYYVVAYCDAKTTIKMIDLGLDNVNHMNLRGYMVLHVAAMRKEPKIIVSLSTKGAWSGHLISPLMVGKLFRSRSGSPGLSITIN